MLASMRRIRRQPCRGSVTRHGLLITLGLSLVIALATGLQVHRVVEQSLGKDHVFECEDCHHQFRIPMDDFDCLHSDLGPYGVVKVCPRCGHRAGLCTISCPSCSRHVLRPDDGICTHCKRNMRDVLSEKTAAAMKRKGITVRRAATTQSTDPRTRPLPDAISIQSLDLFGQSEQLLDPRAAGADGDARKLAWNRSYIMLAYQIMYEATGETDYLNSVLEHTEQVQAARSDRLGQTDEVRGRLMPAWVSSDPSDPRPLARLIDAGMITYPMARCASVARRDPARRVPQADGIIANVDQTIRAFEDDYRDGPGPGEGRYISPLSQADLPLGEQNAMGRTLVAMYLATGDQWYLQRATSLAGYFRNRISFAGGRASWNHSDDDPRSDDIAHAAIGADFALACYRCDVVFSRRDMQQIAATFKGLVKPGGFADRLDGTGSANPNGSSAGAWGQLAWVEPSMRRTLADYLGAHFGDDPPLGMLCAAFLVATQQKLQPEKPYAPPAPSDVAAASTATSQADSPASPVAGQDGPVAGEAGESPQQESAAADNAPPQDTAGTSN